MYSAGREGAQCIEHSGYPGTSRPDSRGAVGLNVEPDPSDFTRIRILVPLTGYPVPRSSETARGLT